MRRVAVAGGGLGGLADLPAVWGVAGAFIYAAPRWAACVIACRQDGSPALRCHLELSVALACGGLAAAAFAGVVLGMTTMKDANAVAAMVGLLVNPTTPVLVRRVSNIVGSALAAKVDDKLPDDPA